MDVDLIKKEKLMEIKDVFLEFFNNDELKINDNNLENKIFIKKYGLKTNLIFSSEVDRKAMILDLRPIILNTKGERKWQEFINVLKSLQLVENHEISTDFIEEMNKYVLGSHIFSISKDNEVIKKILSIENPINEEKKHQKFIKNNENKESGKYCFNPYSPRFFKEIILYAKYYHKSKTAQDILSFLDEKDILYSVDLNLYHASLLIHNALIIIEDILYDREMLNENLIKFKKGRFS